MCVCIYMYISVGGSGRTHKLHTHTCTHAHAKPTPYVYISHWYIVFMTRGTCTCAQACTVRAYTAREVRCTRACAWRMCMGHKHVHADGHSGHVLVECVRADCLLVSCPGASTCSTTRSACCRRASLTSSRRFGEGARVAGGMGPWEFVGACVAWCGMTDVHAASMSMREYMHA